MSSRKGGDAPAAARAAEQKPKRGQDATRTSRQKQYLDRLEAGQGKRMVVDLDAEGKSSVEFLHASGYGPTQKAVINRALVEAAVRQRKKKTT